MPKYKLSIADLDVNVSTNELPEMVHTLEGMIDRRIREIITKSPRCSKSEAAILCALDYCAEGIKGETKTRDMEHEYVRMSRMLENIKQDYEELSREVEKLRRENAVMSDILAKAATPTSETPTPVAPETPAPETAAPETTAPEVAAADGEQIALALPEVETAAPAAPAEPAKAASSTAPAATDVMFEEEKAPEIASPYRKVTRRTGRSKANAANKSKVGDMFDMLTFKDV